LPTSTASYEPYNENTQSVTFESQPTPQQVTPTRSYLDVDVQPISASTYSPTNSPSYSPNYSPSSVGYGEQASQQVTQVEAATTPSTTQNYRDEDIDYLQPTGLEDPRKRKVSP
jgi:hypothetical protein